MQRLLESLWRQQLPVDDLRLHLLGEIVLEVWAPQQTVEFRPIELPRGREVRGIRQRHFRPACAADGVDAAVEAVAIESVVYWHGVGSGVYVVVQAVQQIESLFECVDAEVRHGQPRDE